MNRQSHMPVPCSHPLNSFITAAARWRLPEPSTILLRSHNSAIPETVSSGTMGQSPPRACITKNPFHAQGFQLLRAEHTSQICRDSRLRGGDEHATCSAGHARCDDAHTNDAPKHVNSFRIVHVANSKCELGPLERNQGGRHGFRVVALPTHHVARQDAHRAEGFVVRGRLVGHAGRDAREHARGAVARRSDLDGIPEATMTSLVAEGAAAASVGVLSGRRLQVELCLVRCVKPSSCLAKVCP